MEIELVRSRHVGLIGLNVDNSATKIESGTLDRYRACTVNGITSLRRSGNVVRRAQRISHVNDNGLASCKSRDKLWRRLRWRRQADRIEQRSINCGYRGYGAADSDLDAFCERLVDAEADGAIRQN